MNDSNISFVSVTTDHSKLSELRDTNNHTEKTRFVNY